MWTTLEHIGPQDLSFFGCWKLFFHLFPSFSTIHKPLLHVKEQVKTYRLDPEEADGRGGPCGGHAPLAATEAAQARERKREVATSAPWIKSLQVTASYQGVFESHQVAKTLNMFELWFSKIDFFRGKSYSIRCRQLHTNVKRCWWRPIISWILPCSNRGQREHKMIELCSDQTGSTFSRTMEVSNSVNSVSAFNSLHANLLWPLWGEQQFARARDQNPSAARCRGHTVHTLIHLRHDSWYSSQNSERTIFHGTDVNKSVLQIFRV